MFDFKDKVQEIYQRGAAEEKRKREEEERWEAEQGFKHCLSLLPTIERKVEEILTRKASQGKCSHVKILVMGWSNYPALSRFRDHILARSDNWVTGTVVVQGNLRNEINNHEVETFDIELHPYKWALVLEFDLTAKDPPYTNEDS